MRDYANHSPAVNFVSLIDGGGMAMAYGPDGALGCVNIWRLSDEGRMPYEADPEKRKEAVEKAEKERQKAKEEKVRVLMSLGCMHVSSHGDVARHARVSRR